MLFAPCKSSCGLVRRALGKFPAYRAGFDVLISLLFAGAFFYLWPTDLIYDDGGIVLKYMDNFARGYFYSYNPADGPVFGISGFLHGIVAGAFSYLHVFSPLNSLFASNYLGLVLVSFVSLRILSYYTSNPLLIYPAWLVLMGASPHFVVTVKQGLEAPLHLGVVLLCFLLFLHRKTPWLWLSLVLAVISKLDALPAVLILGVLFLIRCGANWQFALHASGTGQKVRRHARQMLLYGLVPAIAWVAFTFVVFDGPLPQTALSKLYYRGHASGHWFPFFHTWYSHGRRLFFPFVLLFCGYPAFAYLSNERRVVPTVTTAATVLPFGFAVCGYLGLYYYYNPGEQMAWYYSTPEFLVALQIIVVMLALTRLVRLEFVANWEGGAPGGGVEKTTFGLRLSGRHVTILVLAGLMVLGIAWAPRMISWAKNVVRWTSIVEAERIAVGQWVAQHSLPDDTLFSGYGHIAREARIYTIDSSGLNSRIVTDYENDWNRLVTVLQPDWVVGAGLMSPDLQIQGRYALRRSFYNLSGKLGLGTWRIYEREREEGACASVARPVERSAISTDGDVSRSGNLIVDGREIAFAGFDAISVTQFTTGLVKKPHPLTVTVSIYGIDRSLLKREQLPLGSEDRDDFAAGYTRGWEIALDPHWQIDTIRFTAQAVPSGQPAQMTLVAPVYVRQVDLE
jgi:hypothetical protein